MAYKGYKYKTEEEAKEARKQKIREWFARHPDYQKEYQQFYKNGKRRHRKRR